MTPIGDLVARIVARVLDKRQAPEPTPPVSAPDSVVSSRVHVSVTTGCAPVPEDPDLARQAEAWAEPENEAPLFANAPQPEKTPRSKAAESPEAEVR